MIALMIACSSRAYLAFVLAVFSSACGGGSESPAGDEGLEATSGGSGSGGEGSGGTASGGTPGTGGSPGSGGDDAGPVDPGSGTIKLEYNGTPVEGEVWRAHEWLSFGFVAATSIYNDTIDIIDITFEPSDFDPPGVGTYDCSRQAGGSTEIGVQAPNPKGDTTSYSTNYTGECTITITEYGAVGEPVRGTFSAELESFVDEPATITNGEFDLIRGNY